ncbi:MAG: hypothetical protein AAGA54_37035 [Myxococcota bacterium]
MTTEMVPVMYDEQDVSEMLDRQQRDLSRRYKKETKVQLEDLKEVMNSTKTPQVVSAVASGAALEGVAQAADLSEPADAVLSGIVGVGALVGAVFLDEHPKTSAAMLGGAGAALGRASASTLRMLMGD